MSETDEPHIREGWLPPDAPRWMHDPIAVATVVIAMATVVNLFVSVGLWIATANSADVTRKVFEAANRPYVGLDILRADKNEKERKMFVTASMKNFGTVPAEEFESDWEHFYDDALVPGEKKTPDKPKTLFPGQLKFFYGSIFYADYDAITSGRAKLTIIIQLKYKGPENKTYTYCQKNQYYPPTNTFLDLGACQPQEPIGEGR